jgi:hypothetical protein
VTVAIVIFMAVGSAENRSSGGGGGSDGDASARNACRKTQELLDDLDTLTFDEMRDRIKSINNSAEVSDVASVRVAARALLVAMTQGDDPGPAARALANGCRSIM